MSTQLLLLLAAFLLVLLNGFFVAAEFAIVKVRETRIRELAAKGHWRAIVAGKVIDHLDGYLSATQLGITLASLGLGWLGEPAVARLLEPALIAIGVTAPAAIHGSALVIAFTFISFLHIVLGELAPKSLAIRMPETTSLWLAAPLRLFYYLMYPAIVALNGAANAILHLFGVRPVSEGDTAHSEEELRMIVAASHAQGILNASERKLLENVMNFSERRVSEILVPRIDMVCLFSDKSLEENLAIVAEHQHTRYPLATEDKDHILGMIHIKDLFPIDGKPRPVSRDMTQIARKMLFVPETSTIDRLLKTFQRTQNHIAVVVDEYGGIAGMVTMEDVLEEIVGQIRDEFDVEESSASDAKGHHQIVDATTTLQEVSTALKFPMPTDARVHTLGGYILQTLGRVPREGEAIVLGPYRVEVTEMDRTRITKVRFRQLNAAKS